MSRRGHEGPFVADRPRHRRQPHPLGVQPGQGQRHHRSGERRRARRVPGPGSQRRRALRRPASRRAAVHGPRPRAARHREPCVGACLDHAVRVDRAARPLEGHRPDGRGRKRVSPRERRRRPGPGENQSSHVDAPRRGRCRRSVADRVARAASKRTRSTHRRGGHGEHHHRQARQPVASRQRSRDAPHGRWDQPRRVQPPTAVPMQGRSHHGRHLDGVGLRRVLEAVRRLGGRRRLRVPRARGHRLGCPRHTADLGRGLPRGPSNERTRRTPSSWPRRPRTSCGRPPSTETSC